MTNVVMKKAVNPDTGQTYTIELPAPEDVRQAILELEYPPEGLRIIHATERLAEQFQLSDAQKGAKNRSELNVFRYEVVIPQFKRLLRAGKLEQPQGPRRPYVLAEIAPPDKPEWSWVERTAVAPDTGEAYQVTLPATDVVKEALLDFDYPQSCIHITDIAEALADQFALTEEQSKAAGKYGLVWKRHVNIAANSLINAGQLLRIRVGWISNAEQLDIESPEPDDSPFSDQDTPSPEAVMAQSYRKHRDRLKEELLRNIMDNPPEFFEELVLDLLVKMGYGHAEVTGGGGDGGIDGIIYQDPLRLDAVYVQAKRWAEGNVGRPEIDKFIGALTLKGASKGVFITTSGFAAGAKAAANESAGPKIVLIDGEALVQRMIDHDVGVSLGDSYQLKAVDLDYFAIDDDA